MKKLNHKINIFCYKHPDFGIENLMMYVAIGSVVMWLIGTVSPTLYNLLAFNAGLILKGQIWRIITFIFYPSGSGIWALVGAYFYYFIGKTLESNWGKGRFTIYFLTGVVLTELFAFIFYFITGYSITITATYIYLSMFFSFAALFPDMRVLLFFIIPIKMKWLAIVDAVLFVYEIVTTSFPLNLLPVVAILNFFIFCGGELMDMLRISRPSSNTVNFRKESARIRREQQSNLYRHKCSVCGRTDADYPNLEFRYCSRCAGYHCFCEDHINSHVHFTQ